MPFLSCMTSLSGCGPICSVVAVEVLQLEFKAPVKLSDSDRAGSRAGRGSESGATRPTRQHEHGSASDTADPGGVGRLQYLPSLRGK